MITHRTIELRMRTGTYMYFEHAFFMVGNISNNSCVFSLDYNNFDCLDRAVFAKNKKKKSTCILAQTRAIMRHGKRHVYEISYHTSTR